MEYHYPKFHALAAELKARGLLGWAETFPLAEALFTAGDGPGQGIDLVPHAGADPAQVEAAKKMCEEWDWGGRKGPEVRVVDAWREPDGSFRPGQ